VQDETTGPAHHARKIVTLATMPARLAIFALPSPQRRTNATKVPGTFVA
jgi:hypothetical protein